MCAEQRAPDFQEKKLPETSRPPKVIFSETLSIFGDKRPRNGSKNGEMAPRTGTGYPHIRYGFAWSP